MKVALQLRANEDKYWSAAARRKWLKAAGANTGCPCARGRVASAFPARGAGGRRKERLRRLVPGITVAAFHRMLKVFLDMPCSDVP